MRLRHFFILILLAAATGAMAQRAANDTVLKGSTIEVLQSYKPQVKQAPKPEWIPQLPPADTTHPTFSYDVPQQTLYYTYSSQPLRPLALGKEIPKLPFANYIKAGGGNLSTLFLDAGIGGIHGTNYETDIHLHYLSQMGSIKYQQSSLGGIEAEWLQHNHKSDWHTFIDGERNQYYYYGYNHDLHPAYTSDSLKQTFGTLRVGVDMKNNDKDAKFSYNPGITASDYLAAFNTSEVNIGVNVPFEYKFDNTVQGLLAVTGDYAHLTTKDSSKDNTIAAISPGIRVNTGVFTGHAILGLAAGINSNNYILPDISAAVAIPGGKFTIRAGWQATLRQNTYEQLTTENPYIFNTYTVQQTRTDEIFGEMLAGIGDHFTLSGRVSWWQFNGLPTFLNNVGDLKQFYIVYDTVNAVSFKVATRYTKANKWSAGISGDFYAFSGGTQQYVWHEPSTKIKGDFTATVASKLNVSVYLAVMGGIYAKDGSGKTILLNTIADLGGNVEYQIVPRLSAFVQLSNLLNDNYQRWYGYQAYGINIYGGLRLKF